MAFNFSRGNRGFGDIKFEDDADTGIDFEADTVKIETGGSERLVVANTNITSSVAFCTQDNLIVDGRIGIGTGNPSYKLEIGGNMAVGEYIYHRNDTDTYIRFQDNDVRIATGGAERLVVANAQATLNIPLHISQSTTEGLVITKDDGDYREIQFKTIISGTPTDTAFIQVRSDEGLSIGCQSAHDEIIFMTTDGGGTTANAMVITANKRVGIGDRAWDQNATAPSTVLHLESTQPTITFSDSGTDKGTIGINSSDNILIENKTMNKHIVFKVNDQGTVKEGLRLDGAVPEVVVNQTSDSLVDFRVESNNNTHMLFVDGSEDRVGIGTSQPDVKLDIDSDAIRIRNNNTPSSATDFGHKGEIRWDTNYLYICVATDTWKRVALSTW